MKITIDIMKWVENDVDATIISFKPFAADIRTVDAGCCNWCINSCIVRQRDDINNSWFWIWLCCWWLLLPTLVLWSCIYIGDFWNVVSVTLAAFGALLPIFALTRFLKSLVNDDYDVFVFPCGVF